MKRALFLMLLADSCSGAVDQYQPPAAAPEDPRLARIRLPVGFSIQVAVSDDFPRDGHHGWKFIYRQGRMHCRLTVVSFQLTDVNPGDGGLAIIPGSHKSNFPCPQEWPRSLLIRFLPGPTSGSGRSWSPPITPG